MKAIQAALGIFPLLICAGLAGASSTSFEGFPRLENEWVRVTLDPETGGFASLYDKKKAHEYVTAPDRTLLLRFMVPSEEQAGDYRDGSKPDIRVDGDTAILSFATEGIRAEVVLKLQEDELQANLKVSNDSERVIEEIMFPWVRGVGEVSGGVFTWPQFWRRQYKDLFGGDLGADHHTWNELTQKLTARYPGHLASAWCDYGNEEQGLSIETRQPDFSISDFFLHKVVEKDKEPMRRTLDFATVFPRRVKSGEQYESPTVKISLHDEDWHRVADRHRTWLETRVKKPPRPSRFAEAIGWHFFFMKHQDGLVKNTYADLPAMARASLEAGCGYLLLFGWQAGGHDNNYCFGYVPNEDWGGVEALKKGIEACRALGVECIPFFNGTLANMEMPEYKEYGHRWAAKTRTGHPYYAGDWARHNFDAPTRNRSMLHAELSFCAEHQQFFVDTAKRIAMEYGFGNLQLDQISEKMLVDYDETHITSTPDRVFVDGLSAILPEVYAAVRTANPEGVVVGEAINDFTGQWCDSSWDWNILLPYPDPIFYTLPWLMGSHEIDALEFGEVNKAFAYKMHLDMKIDGGDAPISKYPAFAAHVKANALLRQRTAHYCVHADFVDQQGIECAPPRAVLVKAYRNRETGTMGVVMVETEGKPAAFSLTVDREYRGTARLESNQKPARQADLSRPLRVKLNAYEVLVLCIDPAAD